MIRPPQSPSRAELAVDPTLVRVATVARTGEFSCVDVTVTAATAQWVQVTVPEPDRSGVGAAAGELVWLVLGDGTLVLCTARRSGAKVRLEVVAGRGLDVSLAELDTSLMAW